MGCSHLVMLYIKVVRSNVIGRDQNLQTKLPGCANLMELSPRAPALMDGGGGGRGSVTCCHHSLKLMRNYFLQ